MRLSVALFALATSVGSAMAASDAAPADAPPVASPPAAVASPAPASPVDSRLPKPVEQVAFVPSGEPRMVTFLASLNPDCSSVGTTAYRVLVKPEHGDVVFETEKNFAVFPSGNREHCNSEKVTGLTVSYQSKDGFVGEDKFEVLFLLPPIVARVTDFDIIVR